MNELIREVFQQGNAQEVYGLINDIALYIAVLYSFWHGKKLGVPLWKMFVILLALYFGMSYTQGAIWNLLLQMSQKEFFGIQTVVNSIVRVFWVVPVIGILCALCLRLKLRLTMDAIVMFPLLRSAFAQIACLFNGCCAGYPFAWGIYNAQTDSYRFPVPLLETVLTLGIFARLLYLLKKNGYRSDGTYFPRMLFWYGIVRFVCEALRDNEKLLPLCSGVGLHALALCLTGILWLFIDQKVRTREPGIKRKQGRKP